MSIAKAAGVLKKHDDKIRTSMDGRDVVQSIDKIKLNGGKYGVKTQCGMCPTPYTKYGRAWCCGNVLSPAAETRYVSQ